MPNSWSVRRRLLVASSIAIVTALVLGIVAFALALGLILRNAASDAATVQAGQIASLVSQGEYSAASAVMDLPAEGSILQVISRTGHVLAASESQAATTPLVSERPPVGTVVTLTAASLAGSDVPHAIAVRGIADAAGETYTLVVAAPLDTESRTVRIASGLLAMGAVALAVGLLVLMRRIIDSSFEPVERIRMQVDGITSAGTAERLAVPDTRDEIADLALTMNAMLDRLARADEAQHRFISDASHELRSPIATLRATLETSSERESDEHVLMWTETVRLQRLVDDLLLLAKADDRGLALRRVEVDLDDVVEAEVRRLRSVAEGDVRSTIVPARIIGDPERLAQVVRNLGDNALRHTRGVIRLTMDVDSTNVHLDVDNEGSPIPEADRVRIFERFTRLDESRQRDSGGSGLGLAIAQAFARAHGGGITVSASPEGWCRFRVTLPLALPVDVPGA